jgi:low affinity Fe/Cu permease
LTFTTEDTPPEPSRGPLFERFGTIAAQWTGRTSAFLWALVLVIGWALVGPLFHYSDTWQLFINTVTNLVTLLMVFLIQRSQNKDTLALQLKVNELIAAQKGAHNSLINIEQLSEDELRSLRGRFARLVDAVQGSNATSVAVITVDSTVAAEQNEGSQVRAVCVNGLGVPE